MTAGVAARKLLALTLPAPPVSPKLRTPILAAVVVAVGLGVAWLPLESAALLVGGSIFFGLALLHPWLSLYLLIPIIPLSGLLALPLGSFKAGVMELVLALGVAVWLLKIMAAQSQRGRPVALKTGPLFLPFLLFLGAVSLTWLNALSIGASLVETAKWVEMLVLYLFIVNVLPARHIKWVVLVLLLTGMAQAALGLYQFIFKVGPPGFLLFDGRFLRAYGTFAQPNPYGGYLGLLLPLALSLTVWGLAQPAAAMPQIFAPYKQVGQAMLNRLYRLLQAGLLSLPPGLLLAALFASQSRGAWLGVAVAGAVTILVRSKKAAIALATVALVGALVGLAGSFDFGPAQSGIGQAYGAVTQRFVDAVAILSITDVATTPVTDANFATLERLAHWQAAREMWQDNLWLGVGFGNYAVVYPAYAVGRWLDPLGHAHNYLLNIGAEAGLVGITVYLIFWIFIFGLLWRTVQRSDGFYKAVAAGGLGILTHLHIHNMVDNLYVQGMYLHIAIILGLVSIIYRQSRPHVR